MRNNQISGVLFCFLRVQVFLVFEDFKYQIIQLKTRV